jgi:hypothetical protein
VFVGSKKVYRSEIIKQSIDPEWKPFELGVADIGGLDQKLTIKCFDWDKNENKDCILFYISGSPIFDFFEMSEQWRLHCGNVRWVV